MTYNEKQRKIYENKLRESMLKEDCILTSKYESSDILGNYTYLRFFSIEPYMF